MGEIPVPAPPATATGTFQVETGEDYNTQVFYNLKTQQVVGTLAKTDWDIGFQLNGEKPVIRLNSALGGSAMHLDTAFTTTLKVPTRPGAIDASHGDPDSVALKDYESGIFLIDRGFNAAGQRLGYCKLAVLSVSPMSATIRVANLDNSRDTTLTVTLDTTRHMTLLSLQDFSLPAIPSKYDWDVLFTQYMFQFYNPYTAYLVTGVLLNPEDTRATLDTVTPFDDITLANMPAYNFSSDWDAIGYDWKYYDYDEGLFVTPGDNSYVVETREGRYVKLQFLDFYTPTGSKGAPLFRLQVL